MIEKMNMEYCWNGAQKGDWNSRRKSWSIAVLSTTNPRRFAWDLILSSIS